MRARVRIPSLTSSLLKNRSGTTQAPPIVMHQMMEETNAYFISVRNHSHNHGQNDVIIFCLTLARSMVSAVIFAPFAAVKFYFYTAPTPNREPGTLRLRCFYPSVKQHAGRRRRPEADRACCATEGGRRELTLLDGAGAHVIKGAPPA